MKKILLLAAVLIGAATASQAGVRFSFGLPLPPLPLPHVVVREPARVYVPPPVCEDVPPVYYGAPAYVAPPSVYFDFGPDYYRYPRYHSYGGYYRGHYDHHYSGHSYHYSDRGHYRR